MKKSNQIILFLLLGAAGIGLSNYPASNSPSSIGNKSISNSDNPTTTRGGVIVRGGFGNSAASHGGGHGE